MKRNERKAAKALGRAEDTRSWREIIKGVKGSAQAMTGGAGAIWALVKFGLYSDPLTGALLMAAGAMIGAGATRLGFEALDGSMKSSQQSDLRKYLRAGGNPKLITAGEVVVIHDEEEDEDS